jgi:hypothetical protein
VVQEEISPEDPKFLCHLNKELDRDTNCKIVAKLYWKKKKREERVRDSTTREKAVGSARWHGSIDVFV